MAGETISKQSACYLSTPDHVRSFFGMFVYIYTDKGELTLADGVLRFVGTAGRPLKIAVADIVDVRVGSYSRFAKPFRLDYIAVTEADGDTEWTTLFTPTRSWVTPVWETNKIVAEWVGWIGAARAEAS